jgi:hypothetical protein
LGLNMSMKNDPSIWRTDLVLHKKQGVLGVNILASIIRY